MTGRMLRNTHPMPKSKSKSKKSTRTKSQTAVVQKPMSRRDSLKTMALYGAGGALLLGGGAAFALDFRSKLSEADLSKIGQGTPTIVQIHDPTCRLCLALQRETRTALADLDKNYLYLVANITTTDGAAFAVRMGQPHVTLALLDGEGTPIHFINGVTPAETLKALFVTHLG